MARGLSRLAGGVFAMAFLIPSFVLVLAAPVLAGVLLARRRELAWAEPPILAWVVLAIAAVHLLGLLIGETPYQRAVLLEAGGALALAGLFLAVRGGEAEGTRLIDDFFAAMVPLIVVISMAALVKAALLQHGMLLSFIPGPLELYPGGSSLRSDYNVFGLSLLVGAIGIVRGLPDRALRKAGLVLPAIALAVVVAALSMTGSRRTLLLAAMLPTYWLVLVVLAGRRREVILRSGLVLLVAALGAASVFAAISAVEKSERGYFVWPAPALQPSAPAQVDAPAAEVREGPDDRAGEISGTSQPDVPISPSTGQAVDADTARLMAAQGRETDLALLQSMGREHAYGFSTRIGRWQYAWERLTEQGWWRPAGFSYHRAFSCRFVDCEHIDYPHLPLLSEWLIGGVAGLALGLAYLFLPGGRALRIGGQGWRCGVTPMVLVILPSALISGDTLLSTPQFLVAALLALSAGNGCKGRLQKGHGPVQSTPARGLPGAFRRGFRWADS